MSESAAGHFCYRNTERSHHRRQDKRCLIPDPSGAVFVYFYSLYPAKIQRVAAVFHGKGEL